MVARIFAGRLLARGMLVVALVLGGFSLRPGLAQEAEPVVNGQKFGAWGVACQALAVNKTRCHLEQTLLRDTDRVFLARSLAVWSDDGSRGFLALQVPVGAYLPSGIALRAEGAETVHPLTWQSCSPELCEALIDLDDALMQELSQGTGKVVATYRPRLGAEPRVFNFSVSGLIEGMQALRPGEG